MITRFNLFENKGIDLEKYRNSFIINTNKKTYISFIFFQNIHYFGHNKYNIAEYSVKGMRFLISKHVVDPTW